MVNYSARALAQGGWAASRPRHKGDAAHRGYFDRHLQHTNTVFKNKKSALIRELARSPLSQSAHLQTPPAGTSIILRGLESPITSEQIKENAKQMDIRLALVSDYMEHPTDAARHMLILNYASVPQDHLTDGLERVYHAVTQPPCN